VHEARLGQPEQPSQSLLHERADHRSQQTDITSRRKVLVKLARPGLLFTTNCHGAVEQSIELSCHHLLH
jgi:hypothetical protein